MNVPESTNIGLCCCGCGGETTLIVKNNFPRGEIKGAFRKYKKGHAYSKKPMDLPVRFWPKVRKPKTDGCWQWTAYKNNKGYGVITVSGRQEMAHRISWILVNGEIPHGLFVLHACDNPECVNPNHLFLGTHADNMADMARKGRAASRPGEEAYSAKITFAMADEIRSLSKSVPRAKLAEMYKLHPITIWRVVTNKIWVKREEKI
jgi:hypothetical protein